MHRFSQRTGWLRQPTALTALHDRLAAAGRPLLDLTGSNPPSQGFVYPPHILQRVFADAAHYTPDPLGLPAARAAVSAYYRGHDAHMPPERIWIGAGTSDLYAHTMAILCNPGDTWLVPEPGYPLFEYVADLAGVTLAPYPLRWDGAWHLRAADLDRVLARHPRARALAVIAPHNPTGHLGTADEHAALAARCAAHGLALIVDEVFLDYPLTTAGPLPSRAGSGAGLVIALSGVSKVAAFPQGKLAWAAVSGPAAIVDEFLARAELAADAFLNTSTAIQGGLDRLLAEAPAMQQRILARCRANLETARAMVADTPISMPVPAAGWTALLRFPHTREDSEWAALAMESAGVVTHPGYLFGLDAVHAAPYLAVSLLTRPRPFATGLRRLAALASA